MSSAVVTPEDASIRVVRIAGEGCPCGGTHVGSTAELASLRVTKIKAKKDNLKVSYSV